MKRKWRASGAEEGEEEDAGHVRPHHGRAHEAERQRLFAESKGVDRTILARQPGRVLKYLRRIRREGCAAVGQVGTGMLAAAAGAGGRVGAERCARCAARRRTCFFVTT